MSKRVAVYGTWRPGGYADLGDRLLATIKRAEDRGQEVVRVYAEAWPEREEFGRMLGEMGALRVELILGAD